MADWAEAMAVHDSPRNVFVPTGPHAGKTAGAIAALIAINSGQCEILETLVRCGVNLTETDAMGNGIFHCACESGREDIVEIVIEHFKDEPTKLDLPNISGHSPLFVACRVGNVDIIQRLLKIKCLPTRRDKLDSTPLHTAALFGHVEVVKVLIDKGCDPFTYDSNKQSANTIVQRAWSRAENEVKGIRHLCRSIKRETEYSVVATVDFLVRFIDTNKSTLNRLFFRKSCDLKRAIADFLKLPVETPCHKTISEQFGDGEHDMSPTLQSDEAPSDSSAQARNGAELLAFGSTSAEAIRDVAANSPQLAAESISAVNSATADLTNEGSRGEADYNSVVDEEIFFDDASKLSSSVGPSVFDVDDQHQPLLLAFLALKTEVLARSKQLVRDLETNLGNYSQLRDLFEPAWRVVEAKKKKSQKGHRHG
jgi:hypothetical protein